MQEVILSVGIDIGTSTTQLIFSRLTIENLATSYTVPRISIVKKEVTYRSDIYFTPLESPTKIDGVKVKKIVESEYEKANIKPKDLKTGAVIITGETARKQNANLVLESLSELAGDFVVATAGPDLEAVLSARGAGTDVMSKENKNIVVNLDIGGGTSNLAIYEKGKLKGTSCLDIGGRLIKISDGKISYIYSKIKALAKKRGIDIKEGDRADPKILKRVCIMLADQLSQAVNLKKADADHENLYTNNGKPLANIQIDAVTFSGGVADCIYNTVSEDIFCYGDIGVLLGQSIVENELFKNVTTYRSIETIRATVVGAGTHTTKVSGSTIKYVEGKLPIKNIPVLQITESEEQNLEKLERAILDRSKLFRTEDKMAQIAISLTGKYHTSFKDVQQLAKAIIKGAYSEINSNFPLVVIVENDIGKVLGNAINVLLERRKDVICIDGISAQDGDYIDIGTPVANGRVVPVVTKTLIFNS